ncbi:metalloregulator ArsR/SmtB family transcription factor [Alphaproteobacteria bacterium GH1-50]|uniref:Metalloregulator ArsR/SmtB family transcription factor n=1 Tax=Kangsaoukella pontilimi TaxID=2691042 RepID=A0A7C9M9Z6_9RHOB|nr:metalloregulator ArsR/SmtB family transcription factor [Kangsaoukella pontilimi]MXQ07653.1 metalloregulator ArsR/SmtB family transcription factor [Kangsaoukella pontilimi]
MQDDAQLDAIFSALAHPTRRDILARLAKGPATVNELAAPYDISLPAISKHVRVLQNAGFIAKGRNAQFRPCTLDASAIARVADWTAAYSHIWDARFDAMDHVLKNLKGDPE